MNKLFIIPLFVLLMFTFSVSAQKIVLEKGSLAALKGQSELKLDYNYETLSVGKYPTEEAYVEFKKAEYAKKDPKKAEDWENGWKNAREKHYQPKFETQINNYSSGKISYSTTTTKSKYTLILKTTFIEPGYNIGISKMPAFINVEYLVVETANPSSIVAKLVQKKIPGSQFAGYDFDASTRISESYAKAGKMFAGFVVKAIK